MSDRERIALDKKAIVSKSLSYLLVIQTKITLKNERFARKNSYFLTVFQCCPPFLCPRGNRFHCSFTLFFIKRAAGAICSFSQVMRSFSRANCSFAFSLKNNKRFTQKTIVRIPNPDRRQALYQLSYQGNLNNDVMSSKRLTQHK